MGLLLAQPLLILVHSLSAPSSGSITLKRPGFLSFSTGVPSHHFLVTLTILLHILGFALSLSWLLRSKVFLLYLILASVNHKIIVTVWVHVFRFIKVFVLLVFISILIARVLLLNHQQFMILVIKGIDLSNV